MTTHPEIQPLLSDYVDRQLDDVTHAAVAGHLRSCAECRREVEAFRILQEEAGALPRKLAPPRDLWPEVAARIDAAPAAPAAQMESAGAPITPLTPRRPVVGRARAWMAAAAVVLVAVSSGLTALLLGERGGSTAATAPAPEPGGTIALRGPATLVAFEPAHQHYQSTVEELEAALEAQRPRLAPETVAVVEENLRIIDRAIAEARAAMEADPASRELPLLLSGVYRQKVEMLQRAVQLPST